MKETKQMKKLMIAAAVVCAAAFVQAASCSWSTEFVEYADESPVDTGSYWLLSLGSATDVSGISVAEDGTLTSPYSVVGTKMAFTDPSIVQGSIPGLDASAAGKYYALVIWDGLDKAHGGKFGVTDAAAIAIDQAEPLAFKPLLLTNGMDSDDWNVTFLTQDVTAVPEPTSGLLLLLGVAGLALRRRRA